MFLTKRIVLLGSVFFTFFASGCGSDSPNNNNNREQLVEKINVPAQQCQLIPPYEKIYAKAPGGARQFDFYTLAENTNRFPITKSESVYVVGDIHGAWKMLLYSLVNAGIMEYDTPWKKHFKIRYQGQEIQVEIPNLKIKSSANKLILVGDYIAKSEVGNEQITLALLTDVLEKVKRAGSSSVVAIIGNHDLEAVNGVNHSGYPREKHYQDQIYSMIQRGLLTPTYFYNGIWYSHSYLTRDDVREFQARLNTRFNTIPPRSPDPILSQINSEVNQFVTQEILGGTLKNTWLASEAEGRKSSPTGPFNFFYVMAAQAADGTIPGGAGTYGKFPIIMGHLSDLSRKVLRVLTEGLGGKDVPKFADRAHVLCTDTSIYDSFAKGTNANFLRIDYNQNYSITDPGVKFHSCSVSSIPASR